ncbi:MAG: flavodoxin [Propionibacteriaceae bacterium]|nr:flavodoxin [Propionibacteriaceae bacterium]
MIISTFAIPLPSRRAFLALAAAGTLSCTSACGLLGEDDRPPRGGTLKVNLSSTGGQPGSGRTGTLVVYFSLPETTNITNLTKDEENSLVVVDREPLGNAQYLARLIAEATGSEQFRLETVQPYPLPHDVLVEYAQQEQYSNARPDLIATPELTEYDTIFLGYPIWLSDLPMAVYAFLEGSDFSGKTIVPFSTYSSTGLLDTPEAIAGAAPGAAVASNALAVSCDDMAQAPETVRTWLTELGL